MFLKQNAFLTYSWRYLRYDKLERLEFKLEKIIGSFIFIFQCVILAALVAAAMAAPRPDGPPAYGPPAPYHAPAKLPPQPFAYQYGVADDYSGANYEKAENQDANGNLQGSYRVNLPDGRVQIVTYTADHTNGFVADVKYEGTAVYPEEKPYAPAPKYAPAPPKYAPA